MLDGKKFFGRDPANEVAYVSLMTFGGLKNEFFASKIYSVF